MTVRDSKFTPIAFWFVFLALGFVTSFAGKPHTPRKVEAVAERETRDIRGASARD